MSAAPRPTPRAPPGGPGSPFSAGCPILPAPRRASRSFVLAAARLRALHLDPLLDRRPHRHAARRTKNDQTNPLSPAPVFIERGRELSGPIADEEPEPGVGVPRTLSRHATCTYSCTRP